MTQTTQRLSWPMTIAGIVLILLLAIIPLVLVPGSEFGGSDG